MTRFASIILKRFDAASDAHPATLGRRNAKRPTMNKFVRILPIGFLAFALSGTVLANDSVQPPYPKGAYFQCVTEMFDSARPTNTPRLKQLWYVAFAPKRSVMRISLVQNAAPDMKAELYSIKSVSQGVVRAKNQNGVIWSFDSKSKLLFSTNNSSVYIKGTCDRLQ